MKSWLLILYFSVIPILSIAQNSANQNDIEVGLESSEETFDKLLAPVWKEIPYEYQMKIQAGQEDVLNNLSLEILSAKANLGPQGYPLAKINVLADNELLIKWNLNNLKVHALVKATFRFKKFGIKITHNEIFQVVANNIPQASTHFNLAFHNSQFNFNLLANNNFEFNSAQITPQGGVGETLKWIFKNIFSEEEVNRYVLEKINSEMQAQINSAEFSKNIEVFVNNELKKLENLEINISEAASKLKINVQDFKVDTNLLNIKIKSIFDNYDQIIHQCAQDISPEQKRTEDLFLSHNLVEGILKNYSLYEIENEGKILEPLFCFGYKEYDANGSPLGIEEELKLLGRVAKIRYWIRPQTLPEIQYNIPQSQLTMKMRLKLTLQSEGFPQIILKDDALWANIVAVFNIKHIPGKGINLIYENFAMKTLEGKVRLRPFKLSPPIPVPIEKIKRELEKVIIKELEQDSKVTNLIDEQINIKNDFSILLKGHHLEDLGHRLYFQLISQ